MDAVPQQSRLRITQDWLVYGLIRILICIVQALPGSACIQISRFLSWLVGDCIGVRRALIDENLRHAFPEESADERRRMRRGMWLHLFMLACEVARAGRKVHETNWRDHFQLQQLGPLVRQWLAGSPTIIVAGHFGNFEIGGFLAGLLGFPSVTVARPLDNPFLNRFLMRFRQSTGQQIIPSHGSSPIVERLVTTGVALVILGDHYGGPKGCWVEFFGRPASCHKSIGLLSLQYHVPVHIVHTVRCGKFLRFAVSTVSPADASTRFDSVADVTQWFTHELEMAVRQHPDQYWWLHRRWKDTRQVHRRHRMLARIPSDQFTDSTCIGNS